MILCGHLWERHVRAKTLVVIKWWDLGLLLWKILLTLHNITVQLDFLICPLLTKHWQCICSGCAIQILTSACRHDPDWVRRWARSLRVQDRPRWVLLWQSGLCCRCQANRSKQLLIEKVSWLLTALVVINNCIITVSKINRASDDTAKNLQAYYTGKHWRIGICDEYLI